MTRILAAVALGLLLAAPQARAQEAVYLVRHAERTDQSADSTLSPAGTARAASLARTLRDAGITRIVTTDLRRTIETAAPIAAALHLAPSVLPAGDVDGVSTALHRLGAKDRALVVGHSNTLPVILLGLGAGAVTIADDEYDNLFIVVPRAGAAPTVLRVRY